MNYIDAVVIPAPKKNLKKYRMVSQRCDRLYREHGALEYIKFVADDVEKGEYISYPQ